MNINIDMDEVVADFNGYAVGVLGKPPAGSWLNRSEWVQIRQHQRLYRDLGVLPGAQELVAHLRQWTASHRGIHLRFLTAIPRDNDFPWAFTDKIEWAQRHFPGIPVMFGPYSTDKHHHCQPGDILIDDRDSNCQEWAAAGGFSHVYRAWPQCRAWLDKVLPLTL
jgi:5'(3')-deoxyribonucleotidase